jgi:hypothetical protein
MRTIFAILSGLIALVGLVIAIAVLFLPLYYTIKKDEPLYLLLFFVSPIAAGIIAQVFIALSKAFIDEY